MPDREKVIKGVHDARKYLEDREWVDKSVGVHIDALNDALALLKEQEDLGTELTNAVELIHKKNERIEELLKEQETANLYKCPNCGTWVSAKNVVRCKDCGFSLPSSENFILCTAPHESQYQKAYKPIDWFCADGEKK